MNFSVNNTWLNVTFSIERQSFEPYYLTIVARAVHRLVPFEAAIEVPILDMQDDLKINLIKLSLAKQLRYKINISLSQGANYFREICRRGRYNNKISANTNWQKEGF